MRFVPIKSEEQQALLLVHRARDLLARIIQCAPMARFTSGGRIHPESCR
jgi:transposase